MGRSLREKVVVITGASSGIGRAAVERLAGEGAVVVLASRRRQALEEAAEACRHAGAAQTLIVPTDVTDEKQVHELGQQAFEHFGRIDAWVNNAAVTLFARLEEAPLKDYRQVIETNVFGYVHGCRTALRYFREQGHGCLINVSSVVSSMPQPYTSAYVMSKQAIRGLSDCLRMELELDEARQIHVCTVLPASIDTPLFQHAANYTGRSIKPMQPVYPASQVAEAIVQLIRRPHRERIVGTAGRAVAFERVLAPGLWEKFGAHTVDNDHLQRHPADPTSGNLFETNGHASASGGWLKQDQQEKPRSGAGVAAIVGAAVVLAAPLALMLLGRDKREKVGQQVRHAGQKARDGLQHVRPDRMQARDGATTEYGSGI